MSKFCTSVSQKRPTKLLYSALLASVLLSGPAHALETASIPAAANKPMIMPDTSIFAGCEIETLKIPTGATSTKGADEAVEWVRKNSYEFNKRNMTVAKAKQMDEKIQAQGERAFMMNRMNDPEIKKNYLEQVAIRLEITKIQDAVYKCVHANIIKNSQEELKRLRSQDSNRITDAMPVKAIAIQMALNNRVAELNSDVKNYGKSCFEKEPTDLVFIDNQQCQERFQRMSRAQILVGPYSQLRADIDAYSTDDKAFEKAMNANVAYQNLLEKERASGMADTTNAVAPAAKPAVN